jgi:hypothetical protein
MTTHLHLVSRLRMEMEYMEVVTSKNVRICKYQAVEAYRVVRC